MRSKKALGAICLITALAMFAGCHAPQSTDPNANIDQSFASNTPPPEPLKMDVDNDLSTPKAPAKADVVKKPAAKKTPARTAGAKAPATTTTAGTLAADTTPPPMPVVESRTVAVKRQEEEPIATILSGCLEHDEGMFRLKDTDGEHAPKTRSWKSGFIRKGSARVDVVDAGNRFKLGTFVGYRVSVSGALVDRQIQAQSVRPSSERCD